MSRKTGDGKKAYLGGGGSDYEFPPESFWLSYERKIGRKVPSALRDKIGLFTMLLAMGAPAPTQTTTKLEKSIDLWKRQTQSLRNQIRPSSRNKTELETLTRLAFTEQFDLNKLKKPFSYDEPLSFLK